VLHHNKQWSLVLMHREANQPTVHSERGLNVNWSRKVPSRISSGTSTSTKSPPAVSANEA
jgi:hypothetical protein